jgi:hypothetical protein
MRDSMMSDDSVAALQSVVLRVIDSGPRNSLWFGLVVAVVVAGVARLVARCSWAIFLYLARIGRGCLHGWEARERQTLPLVAANAVNSVHSHV